MKRAGFLWVFLLAVFPWAVWGGWEIEQPGGTSVYGYWTSLSLDSAGEPHFVYRDSAGGGNLRYVWHSSSGWTGNIVEGGLDINGGNGSLALTAAGVPRISYVKTGFGLRFAEWTGSTWTVRTVDPQGALSTSLKIDSTGKNFISYFSSDSLKCATWDGVSWSTATVDRGGVGLWSSLALKRPGRPVISYYDQTNRDLKLAQWDGSKWSTQTVKSSGNVGRYTSLALDSSGNPSISYDGGGSLEFARWSGSTWTFQTVDVASSAYTSLALDAAGNPVIAYESNNSSLNIATRVGTVWSTSTVDNSAGRYASLALGLDGSPYITYGPTFLAYAKNEVLAVPLNVRVSSRTATGLEWSWTDGSSGETGYRVLRSSDMANLSGDLPANRIQWAQTGLTPNTSAQIVVRAFNGFGVRDSLPSPVSFSLAGPPINVKVQSFSGTTATITWSGNGNSSWTDYRMEKSTDGVSYLFVSTVTALQARATDLADGTTTYFRVRSINAEGILTDFGNTVSLFISPTSPPNPPKHLVAKDRTTSSITWGWTDDSDWETLVRVLRSTDLVQISADLPANTQEWTETGFSPNTSSQIVVRASNTFGSSDSLESPVRYSLAAVPGTPAVNSFYGTVATVSWAVNGNPGGTKYRLEKSPDTISYALVAVTTNTVFEAPGLIAGTTNYFRVRAENGDGIATVYSSTASVYLPPVSPPTPPGVPEVKERTSHAITWTWVDNASTETAYRVLRSSALVPLSEPLPVDTVEWTESVLTPNTSSQIVVRAENAWGQNDSLDSPVRYSLAEPPIGLGVGLSSATEARVSWSPNGNPLNTRYRLEKSAVGDSFSLVSVLTATETVAAGLIDGATNYFRVRAENGDGVATLYSSTVSVFVPRAVPPTFPGPPFVSHQSSSTLTWAWADSENETGFIVLLSSGLMPLSDQLTAGTVEWTQTGLTPNASAQIVVRAVNAFGHQDSISSPVLFSLAVPPGAPEVSVTGTSGHVHWIANGNSPNTAYFLEKSLDGETFTIVAETTATFAAADDLLDGTTAYFRLRAENGNTIPTDNVLFSAFVPATAPPSLPGIPTVAHRTDSEIRWMWSDNSHNETGFRVVRDSDSFVLASLPAGTTSWIQTGLSPNSLARVQLEAFNEQGSAQTSRDYSMGEESTLANAPVGTTVATVTPTSVTLEWGGSGNPPGTLYLVTLSTDNLTFRPLNGGTEELSLTANDLVSGLTYYFRVDSLNKGRVSSSGTVVSTEIPFGPPPSPLVSWPEVVRGPSSIQWKWSNVVNAQGYRILRASDGVNLSGSDLSAGTLEWTQNGLVPNSETAVRIEAFNHHGTSSAVVSVFTPPLPPADVHVDRVLPLQFILGWADNGNAPGTSFLPEISTDNIHFESVQNYVSGFTSTITNLEENTSYYLRVKTLPVDPIPPPALSGVILTSPLQTIPPPPPVETHISAVFRSSITVAWDGAGTLFEIGISTNNSDFSLLQPVGLDQSVTARSLAPDTTYFFRVRALNLEQKKYSAYDVTVSTFLQAMPYAPMVLSPVRNPDSIVWRWGEVSNAVGYRILRTADSQNISGGDLFSGTSYWVQTNVGPSQPLSVEIQSFNSYGVAGSTAYALSLPAPPVNSKVTAVTPTQIEMSWEGNGNIDGTLYSVDVSTVPEVFSNTPMVTSEKALSFYTVMAGTSHFMRVRARNSDADGYSAYDVLVSTLYRSLPLATVGAPFANAVGTDEITWAWTNSLEGVTGYRVLRVEDLKDLSGLLHAGQQSWTQTGLSPNAPVQTMIRAEGSLGVKESVPGAVVHTLPHPPKGTRLTGFSYGKASLSWDTNGNPNGTTYAVYYSSGAWDPIVSTQVTGGSATVIDLSPKTSYLFSVRAVGAGGESLPDQSISVTTTGDPIHFELANPDWLISTVDSRSGAGEYLAMVLDKGGAPRIVYKAGENLMLAGLGTRGWSRETVVSEAHVGAPVSVLSDAQDHTQVAYFIRLDRTFNYVAEEGGPWSALTVPHDTVSGSGWAFSVKGQGFHGTALQRTSDGIPVVAYTSHIAGSDTDGRMDHGTYMVFEARRLADSWVKSLLASFPTGAITGSTPGVGDVRLALDSKGNSHMVFFHSTGPASALYYAYREGENWKTEPLELNAAGINTSIAIQMGEDDSLHVLYSDTSNQKVRYAVRENGQWTLETVEEGKSFGFVDIALDGRGTPHVVFTDLDAGILRYARRQGSVWATQTVDGQGKTGWYPSIAVDARENVHVAYYDFTNKVLKYAALVSQRLVMKEKMPREGGRLEFVGSRGAIRLDVPAGAFLQDVTISVKSPDLMVLATAQKRDVTPLGVGLEISATPALRPLRAMTLTFPYDEADLLPGKHESRLTLAKYDESAGEWVPVPTQVDTTNNRLTSRINDFTVYQVMWMGISPSVSEARAYPNPFRPGQSGHDRIVFDDLPTGAQVKIYTITGEFVQELPEDGTGRARWDAHNANGDPVASGVYFARIEGTGGDKILKVAVQR